MGESVQSNNVLGARPKTLVYGRRRNHDTTFIVSEILPEESKQHGNRGASILPTNADISTGQQQFPRQQQPPSKIMAKEKKNVESVIQFKPNSTPINMRGAPPKYLFHCYYKKPRNHYSTMEDLLPQGSKQRRNRVTSILPTNADISTTQQQQVPTQQQQVPTQQQVPAQQQQVPTQQQQFPTQQQQVPTQQQQVPTQQQQVPTQQQQVPTQQQQVPTQQQQVPTQQQQVPTQQQPPSEIVAKEKKNVESVTQYKPNSTPINVRGAPPKNLVHFYYKKPRNHYSTMEDLLPQGSKQRRTSILPTNAGISTTGQQQVPRLEKPTFKIVAKEKKNVESVTQFKPNSTLKNLEKALSCPICMELAYKREPTSTKCGHVFCKSCITQSLRLRAKCPTCNMPLNGDMIFRIYL